MKKFILAFIFLFVFTLAEAQQSFLFRIKYLPGSLYEADVNTDMNMKINFSGDSAVIARIKSKGTTLPMTIISKSNTAFNVKTGAVKAGNLFPIALFYKSYTEQQTLNGAEKSSPPNPLAGQTIFAKYSLDGKIKVDSISGKTIDDQMKEALSTMMSNMLNQMHFPETPMKIGDTFTQDVPFNMPLPEFNMQDTIKITYKLVSVENNRAFFNMDESMNIDITTEKNSVTVTVKGSGKGGGKLEYDINKNYAPSRNASLKMDYQMQMGNLNMTGAAQISTTTQIKMSALTK